MAARTNLRQQEQTRAAIQTSQLVNRLQRFALAEPDVEIDAGRLKAIEVLLRKSLPDLSAVSVDGSVTVSADETITGLMQRVAANGARLISSSEE